MVTIERIYPTTTVESRLTYHRHRSFLGETIWVFHIIVLVYPRASFIWFERPTDGLEDPWELMV